MSKNIKAGGWEAELLAPGETLHRGGEVPEGAVAIRTREAELVSKRADLATFLAVVHEQLVGRPLAVTDPHILLVGDLANGFVPYGPFPAEDPDGNASARMRALEQAGEEFCDMELRPTTDLVPVDPDEQPATRRTVTGDIEVDGLGAIKAGEQYIVTVTNGQPTNAYALIGHELIEAHDFTADGTPDFNKGSMLDPCRGEEGFFYPAFALLRHLNQADTPAWAKADHEDLTSALRRLGIEWWTYDAVQECYRMSTDGGDEQFVIRTPADARAYMAGLHAVRVAP